MVKNSKLCLLLIIIVLVLFGCKSNSDSDKNTRFFSSYLNEVHKIKLTSEKNFFIIFPRIGCKGCMQRELPILLETIKEKNNEKFSFIISNPEAIQLEKLKLADYAILLDKDDKISKLDLRISGITMIKTVDYKVLEFYYIQEETFDKNTLFRFIDN